MHERPNVIERVDPDETKLFEVRKHPLGIIFLYIQAALGMILAVGLAYFLLPVVLDNTDSAFRIGNIFAAVSTILTFIVVLIATVIYRENRLIVTDRSITQILQYGLFNRKVSQLNLHNVEDVTALQDGFFPTAFNYGTLNVETAGEQVNFHFTFCPNVGQYAKIILDAREKMLGQMKQTTPATPSPLSPVKNNPPANSKSAVEAIKDLGSETVKQASIDS